MKHLIILAFLSVAVSVFACFMQDPHVWLSNITIAPTENVEVEFPMIERPEGYPSWSKPKDWPTSQTMVVPPVDVYVTFPLTFQMEFTGFEDNSRVTRMCLLYYNVKGKWVVLRDIRNPQFSVSTNTGDKRAMFGRYVIPNQSGYKTGDIIPTIAYFESETSRTHNLSQLLDGTLKWDCEGVLYLGIINNKKPQ